MDNKLRNLFEFQVRDDELLPCATVHGPENSVSAAQRNVRYKLAKRNRLVLMMFPAELAWMAWCEYKFLPHRAALVLRQLYTDKTRLGGETRGKS